MNGIKKHQRIGTSHTSIHDLNTHTQQVERKGDSSSSQQKMFDKTDAYQ